MEQRGLSEQEVRDLLRPKGNVGRAYVIASDGSKHYVQSGHLPDAVVGSFKATVSGTRRYLPGSEHIVAYREGDK